MKKDMICFDIDGTLRDNVVHRVSESTLYTLQQLRQNGYKLVVATGRGVDSLKKTGLIDIFSFDGYVCNNGQTVLDQDLNILSETYLSHNAICEVMKIAKELDLAVVLKGKERIITKEADEYVKESARFFNSIIPNVGEYTGQLGEAMIVYGPKGYDYAPFLGVKDVEVLPGESTYADITIKSVSKQTGIKTLMSLYGCETYIAFGDSLNDVIMFQGARVSIAMGQGNEYLKSIATYVALSIEQDGIYHACLDLGYIKGERK